MFLFAIKSMDVNSMVHESKLDGSFGRNEINV